MVKLKPCPYCGRVPDIRKRATGHESGCFVIYYEIECCNCHISFSAQTHIHVNEVGEPVVDQNGYKDCIDRWNSRFLDEEELEFTRKYIRDQGLEWDLLSKWEVFKKDAN